jgi:hypothetical protein
MRRLIAAAFVGVCALSGGADLKATTVIEPTFEQLVTHADAIFEGVVVNVGSTLRFSSSGRTIVTSVSFEVKRVLKGSLPGVITLEFLGGTVGDLTLEVFDIPRFARGDEDLMFVRTPGTFVSPIVAFMHGRFRIVRTSTKPEVRRFDGRAFGSVTRLGRPSPAGVLPSEPALSLEDFETTITAEVARQVGSVR